jgi:hypothetical protein
LQRLSGLLPPALSQQKVRRLWEQDEGNCEHERHTARHYGQVCVRHVWAYTVLEQEACDYQQLQEGAQGPPNTAL